MKLKKKIRRGKNTRKNISLKKKRGRKEYKE